MLPLCPADFATFCVNSPQFDSNYKKNNMHTSGGCSVRPELTHLSMLSQNADEVKLVETQQHDKFILGFAIISRLLHMETFTQSLSGETLQKLICK